MGANAGALWLVYGMGWGGGRRQGMGETQVYHTKHIPNPCDQSPSLRRVYKLNMV